MEMNTTQDLPLLELKDVSVLYEKNNVILQGIHFALQKSEFIAIIGPNGSGKSTLLKAIAGILKISSGEFHLMGKPFTGNKRIAYLPQLKKHEIRFPIPVYEVVALARHAQKGFVEHLDSTDREIIQDNLKKTGMWDKKDRCFCELSEGQKQRVLIARTLATDSPLILMDEPTTGLDSDSRDKLYQIIRREKENGRSILMVSHDIPEIYRYADRVACIMKKIFWNTDPRECQSLL